MISCRKTRSYRLRIFEIYVLIEFADVAFDIEYRRKLNEPILIGDIRDLNKRLSVLETK
jgi:hypothetical protein